MATFIKKILLTCSVVFLLISSANSTEIAGVNIEDKFGENLILNGAGVRDKFFIDLYVGALYLKEKSSDATLVIEADKAMSIKLHIVSSMITSEKMENGTREGFIKSTGGNIAPLKEKIETFLSIFKEEMKENDIYDLVYTPNIGVEIFKNKQLKTTIDTLEFKKALFGIWLGEEPAQSSLKKDMLGL